ncbi:acetyl-CoA carboxylase, biotin carboxyl carrier protein [Paracoccus sp. S-4012]|uniref:acetyl-CoA carboxylase biotin carboxyl carrier protein n=1 Tax=Paracoccus sp. S-4012 TaxID=2665648 RepID=UPI0012B0FE58|nr:acetyl-CoA carboxylase biotin carboxyl carrier protein subunit [Paracoccus sp. S-4012]MRX49524.1 acetyl-CoA carboxylase, biotin carboxyl carrier protein [Paracoccus sp. S-4012]
MTDDPQTDSTGRHGGDVAFISALAELLNRNELAELEVKREYGENDRLTVKVVKQARPVAVPQMIHAPQPAAAPQAAAPQAPEPRSDDPASLPGAITSPMVGTAYLSAEPGAAAFVTLGQQVAEGDTLLIVEAMKTMNHIPAPRAGIVRRILVDDGSPVEFGTPLMVLE